MITAFRRYLDTWVVRGFFMIMVAAFVLWGVGDVLRLVGTSSWVVKAGGETIEAPQFQAEYQRDMAQASRSLPAGQEASAELRRKVGDAAVRRLVTQAGLAQEYQRLRIVSPDAAVRAQILAMPAFRGNDGAFNRQMYEALLRNNGLSEPRFLEMMRSDLAQQQLLEAVSAGGSAPAAEADALFAAEFEKRSADTAEFAIAAQPAPAAPNEAELKRWYDNHPQDYSTPEYRRIRAVVLSPQTLASEIPISDDELRAAYDQRKAQYITPAKRSAEVLSVPDEAKAKALAEKWNSGADWAAMQEAAQQDGGSGIELTDARQNEFSDPALAKAVFAAPPDTVVGPVKSALSWHMLKVTKVEPGTEKSFDEVKQQLREQVLVEKATDLMYDRANKLDNLLGNGTPLDQLPSNLGLSGVAGTLDAEGNDKDGKPAPIPGPPALRQAIVSAAFKLRKGDLPQLTEVRTPSTGGSAYYALSVEDIIPPGEKPFDEVKQRVATDWADAQQRHEAETQAAKMLTALKGGQSFADAATVAGVQVRRTPLTTRTAPAEGLPPELQRVLFGLKQGEPTMVETPEGFVVAVPAEVVEPDPKSDPTGYSAVQRAVNQSIGGDLATVFTEALRQRANPRVNKANFDSIVQPQ